MLLLLLVIAVTSATRCSEADTAIYKRVGHSWPHAFRAFAGLTVSKAEYETQVVETTGITKECATCYGDAYICGYGNCKWSCLTEGPSCDLCLRQEGCVATCNACTGFPAL